MTGRADERTNIITRTNKKNDGRYGQDEQAAMPPHAARGRAGHTTHLPAVAYYTTIPYVPYTSNVSTQPNTYYAEL